MNRKCNTCGNYFDISDLWIKRGYYYCNVCHNNSVEIVSDVNKTKRHYYKTLLRKYMKMSDQDASERLLIIFGCYPSELRTHIENKFVDGMTWGNYCFNGWHIDHIIPLFSAKKSEDLVLLSHYTTFMERY